MKSESFLTLHRQQWNYHIQSPESFFFWSFIMKVLLRTPIALHCMDKSSLNMLRNSSFGFCIINLEGINYFFFFSSVETKMSWRPIMASCWNLSPSRMPACTTAWQPRTTSNTPWHASLYGSWTGRLWRRWPSRTSRSNQNTAATIPITTLHRRPLPLRPTHLLSSSTHSLKCVSSTSTASPTGSRYKASHTKPNATTAGTQENRKRRSYRSSEWNSTWDPVDHVPSMWPIIMFFL